LPDVTINTNCSFLFVHFFTCLVGLTASNTNNNFAQNLLKV